MGKELASLKQTSGAGFVFEDKAVAYLLLWMLSGTERFKIGLGRITEVECQVKVDGWNEFDDVVVSSDDGGIQRRVAFSIKSNEQFTKKSAPADAVRSGWELLEKIDSPVMGDADRVGMICVPLGNDISRGLNKLLLKAEMQEPERLERRINEPNYASEIERDLYASFKCPSSLQLGDGASPLSGRLLSRFKVLELDFENLESESEVTAKFVCSCLVEGNEADSLWLQLKEIAQQKRIGGGSITREQLQNELRKKVNLLELPDYANSWKAINEWSEREISGVSDSIGGEIRIERESLQISALDTLQHSRFIAVVGRSGLGKSELAKRIAEFVTKNTSVLWFRGERINPGFTDALASELELDKPFSDVLKNRRHTEGLVILDQAERVSSEESLRELSVLMKAISLHENGGQWRVLITCREENWEKLQLDIGGIVAPQGLWSMVEVSSPSYDELRPIFERFPYLGRFAARPHLSQIFSNLKVLDLFALGFTQEDIDNTEIPLGETKLIDLFWRHQVQQGAAGLGADQVVKRVACKVADMGVFTLPLSQFVATETELLGKIPSLVAFDPQTERLSFCHDIVRDWALFRFIKDQENPDLFVEGKGASPHWHPAIRLYALSLLEDGHGLDRWRESLNNCVKCKSLFLDALIFTGNSKAFLEDTWEMLIENKGQLLSVFLLRFQYVASRPNPRTLAIIKKIDPKLVDEFSTLDRLPKWTYWPPVLAFLDDHTNEVVELVPYQAAMVAKTWLKNSEANYMGRKEAVNLVLAIAERKIREIGYGNRDDQIEKVPFEALLGAFIDEPEKVKSLLELGAGMVVPDEKDGDLYERYEAPGTVIKTSSPFYGKTLTRLEPWPSGPHFEPHDILAKICLESGSLVAVFLKEPSWARRLLIALLIEEPQRSEDPPDPDENRFGGLRDTVGLRGSFNWNPCMFDKGPFLSFLLFAPDEGLKTIIELVDFATHRYMERYGDEANSQGMTLLVDGEDKFFIGNHDVFHWFHGLPVSEIITCALMALEKYFYGLIEKKENVTEPINLLMGQAESVAFLGVLTEVARSNTELLEGPLRPLLLAYEIPLLEHYYFDRSHSLKGTPTGGAYITSEIWEKIQNWDRMPHRKTRLVPHLLRLFGGDEKFRSELIDAKARWKIGFGTEAEVKGFQDFFDIAQWEPREGSSHPIIYDPPKDEGGQLDQQATEAQWLTSALITHPIKCREILELGEGVGVDNCTDFLDFAKKIAGAKVEDLELLEIAPPSGAILGSIAVLNRFHKDWLLADPQRDEWCRDAFKQLMGIGCPVPRSIYPQSIGKDSGQHFAAELTIDYWLEEDGFKVRHNVIQSLSAVQYNVSGVLLSQAFKNRGHLGSRFWQLVNLSISLAGCRWQVTHIQSHLYRLGRTGVKLKLLTIRDFLAKKWGLAWLDPVSCEMRRWKKKCKRFCKGGNSEADEAWGELAVQSGKLLWGGDDEYYEEEEQSVSYVVRHAQIDLEQIQVAFDGLFRPSEAFSKDEETRFIWFWEQALQIALSRTRFYNGETRKSVGSRETNAIPYDSERWVLDQVSRVVLESTNDKDAERLWKPIIEVAPFAEHWIESFLSSLFKYSKEVSGDDFVRRWKSVSSFYLEYVAKDESHVRNSTDVYAELLGFSSRGFFVWFDKQDFPTEFIDDFASFCPHVLKTRHATHVLGWLYNQPAGKVVLKQMLNPIHESIEAIYQSARDERRVGEVLARVLSDMWNIHRADIEMAGDRDTFLATLQYVADKNEPLAIVLQDKIFAQG